MSQKNQLSGASMMDLYPRVQFLKKKNRELFIISVKHKHAGKYECFGTYDYSEFVARALFQIYSKFAVN